MGNLNAKLKDLICFCKCPEDECIYKVIYLLKDDTTEYGTKYPILQKNFLDDTIKVCGKFDSERRTNPDMTLTQYLKKYQKISDEVFAQEVENKRDFNGHISETARKKLENMLYDRCKYEEIMRPRMEVINIEVHEI